jgi:hypothetical protein
VQLKDILKLVGAGVTGGLLALKIRGPRKPYGEFLRVYEAVSIEFRHQFETVFLQTLLPAVTEADRDDLCSLLDRQSTFQEQLRFFQGRVPDFEERVIKAFERLYRLRAEGSIAPTTRRRLAPDLDSFTVGVSEVFHDLEQAFLNAIQIQLPDTKTQYEEGAGAFPSFLREVGVELPSLSAAFFDGLVKFDDKMSRPTLSD